MSKSGESIDPELEARQNLVKRLFDPNYKVQPSTERLAELKAEDDFLGRLFGFVDTEQNEEELVDDLENIAANFNEERCPLAGGGMATGDIPDFCIEHCEKLWLKAIDDRQVDETYDIYGPGFFDDEAGCRHEDTELEYSHSGLQSLDDSARRIYAIVDQCESCKEEFGEQGYKFDCLNS